MSQPVKAFDAEGKAGEERVQEDAVGLVVGDVFEPVAVLGVVEALIFDLPAAAAHAEEGSRSDGALGEGGGAVGPDQASILALVLVAEHTDGGPGQRVRGLDPLGVPAARALAPGTGGGGGG